MAHRTQRLAICLGLLSILFSGSATIVFAAPPEHSKAPPPLPCTVRKAVTLQEELPAAGKGTLQIFLPAGRLRIEGGGGGTSVRLTGQACAPTDRALQGMSITSEASGSGVTVRGKTTAPGSEEAGTLSHFDILVQMPHGTAVEVEHAGGPVDIQGSGALTARTGWGDLMIQKATGDVILEEGDGDTRIQQITGSVHVRFDTAGDLKVEQVSGSVTIDRQGMDLPKGDGTVRESSGELVIKEIGGDVIIRRHGPGDIQVDDVGGGLTIEADAFGDVTHEAVRGAVRLPSVPRAGERTSGGS